MNIKLNDETYVYLNIETFKKDDCKYVLGNFVRLADVLKLENYTINNIEISDIKSAKEAIDFINYFKLDIMKSIKNLNENEIDIFYKPYMNQNTFKFICDENMFNKIKNELLEE